MPIPIAIGSDGLEPTLGPGQIGKGHITPLVDLRVFLTSAGTELLIVVRRSENDAYFVVSTNMRIYFVPFTRLSPLVIEGGEWFPVAQHNKTFVTSVSFGDTNYIETTVPVKPYAAGGWFYAVQVLASGIETPGSEPTILPNINPNVNIPRLLTEQVQNVTVAQENINGIIKLTFRWQLPNVIATPNTPIGPLENGHVQIWMYNYMNLGDWRQFAVFNVRAKTLQYETGTMLSMPDFDGLHNVEMHFVASNQGYVYKEPFWDLIPAPFVTLVGGVGP